MTEKRPATSQIAAPTALLDEISATFGTFERTSNALDLSLGTVRGIAELDEIWQGISYSNVGETLRAYPGTQGTVAFGECVAALRKRERGEGLDPATVVATHGALDGIAHALAPLPPGSSVLYPSPGWVFHVPITRAGHKAVPLPWPLTSSFGPWLQALDDALRTHSQPSGVIVNFPRNPSGQTATPDEWRQLSSILSRYDSLLVVDDVYGCLDPTTREFDLPPNRVVTVDSLSKRLGAPGLRLGYIVCSGDTLPSIRRSAARTSVGVSPLILDVGAQLLSAYLGTEAYTGVKAELDRRREIIRRAAERDGMHDRLIMHADSLFYCIRTTPGLSSADYLESLGSEGLQAAPITDASDIYLRFCLGTDPLPEATLAQIFGVLDKLENSHRTTE